MDSISQEVREVFEHSKGAVVRIEGTEDAGTVLGTGFFVDTNGTLFTSYSVGGDTRDLVVSLGDLKFPARRLVADSRSGVAILKIESPGMETPFLPMAKGPLEIASPVVTVAYPMDMGLTPNFGMVSGFDLKFLGRYFATRHIRASVPVQRGEGGAPLLNLRGEVVGMVISSLDGGASCFAVPINVVEKISRDYFHFGRPLPGFLGLVVNIDTAPVQSGSAVMVESVQEGSPADKAGLFPGDVLLQIGSQPIRVPEDVVDASFFLTAGEPVEVKVLREGHAPLAFQVEPAEKVSAQSPPAAASLTFPVDTEDVTLRLP